MYKPLTSIWTRMSCFCHGPCSRTWSPRVLHISSGTKFPLFFRFTSTSFSFLSSTSFLSPTVLGYIFQVVHFQKSAGVTSDYTTLKLQTNKADLSTKNNHPLLSISVKLPTLTIPHYITWSRDLLGPHCATPYFGQVPASRVSPEEFSAVKTPASVTSVR